MDRFSNILVTQTLSVGTEKLKPILFPILAEVLRADGQTIDGIYERNDEALRAKEGLEQNKGWFELPGETHPANTQTEICENGVYYHVDFENGRRPVSSLIRSTTVGRWHALLQATPCWTALPTPAALH